MQLLRAPRTTRAAVAVLTAVLGLLLAAPAGADEAPPTGSVLTMEVSGAITAVTEDRISDAIDEAETSGANALLIQLDTPGGQLETTRNIVQAMLLADVPVIVHVAPAGARAGSAGTFITYAAHVAVMNSGTTIGAATPVDMEGGEVTDKILQDSVSYAEALAEERGRDTDFIVDAVVDGRAERATVAHELGAVDLLAGSQEELLAAVDGQEVTLESGETVTLATADATVVEIEQTWMRTLLGAIATPDIAFLLITIGTLAVIYELANPGVGLGGAIGGVMLILAFYSLSVLPTTIAGVALLALGLALLVGELFVPGVGVMAGGGAIALLAAGLLLFDGTTGLGVSWIVLLPTVLLAAGAAVGLGVMLARQRGRPSSTGAEALEGATAEVRRVGERRLQVWLDGSLWEATCPSGAELKPGDTVTVVGREGLRLFVEPQDEPKEQPWTSTR